MKITLFGNNLGVRDCGLSLRYNVLHKFGDGDSGGPKVVCPIPHQSPTCQVGRSSFYIPLTSYAHKEVLLTETDKKAS